MTRELAEVLRCAGRLASLVETLFSTLPVDRRTESFAAPPEALQEYDRALLALHTRRRRG